MTYNLIFNTSKVARMWNRFLLVFTTFILFISLFGSVNAEEVLGVSKPWQMGFREAASPVMERIIIFHDFLMIIAVGISVFVMALLAYVMIRFRASKNSKT